MLLWSDLDFAFTDSFTLSTISNLYNFKNTHPYLLQNRHFISAYVWCQYYNIFPISEYTPSPSCSLEVEKNLSMDSIWIAITWKNALWGNIWSFHDQEYWFRKSNLISTNNFYKIDYTVHKNIVKEFINGRKIYEYTTSTWGFSVSNTWTFSSSVIRLWWWSNNTRDFDGIIDEVKIYNRALTPEKILQQAKIAWF